jgi:hypothetical protein
MRWSQFCAWWLEMSCAFWFFGGNFVRRSMSIFAVMMLVVSRCVASAADPDTNRTARF